MCALVTGVQTCALPILAREAPLVELIRDAESDTPGVDLVVAWRLEDELNLGRDGVERVRLRLYDPRRGAAAVSLRLTLAEDGVQAVELPPDPRSEEHTSELQSLMRTSYAVFCLK